MVGSRQRWVAGIAAMAVLLIAPLAVVASDAFTDVPDSNVHHDDIAWMKDAGVTKGCNPPANTEFCPGDPVLRQQMASFMRRLAENQVVDAATAVSAENINNVTIERFFFQAPANTADASVGEYGPMTLRASCDAAGEPTLRASWDEDVDVMTYNGAGSTLTGSKATVANTIVSIGSGQFGSVGLTEAIGHDSQFHTSVEYFLRDAPAIGDDMCFFSGFVTSG